MFGFIGNFVARKLPSDPRKAFTRRLGTESLELRQMLTGQFDAAVVQAGTELNEWQFDFTRDRIVRMDRTYGLASHENPIAVAGDWDGDGSSDMGVVIQDGQFWRWLLDTDGDPEAELNFIFGQVSLPQHVSADIPVVGDWDGNGTWTPGVARAEPDQNGFQFYRWLFDNDFDPSVEGGNFIFGGPSFGDVPVTGDWNSDGNFDVGVARPEADVNGTFFYRWYYDTNRAPDVDGGDFLFGGPSFGHTPITGDWNGDGKTDAGATGPDPLNPSVRRWYYDMNDGEPTAEVDFVFGRMADMPVAGHWHLPELSVALDDIGNSPVHSPTTATLGTGQPGELANSRTYYLANIGTDVLRISRTSIPNGFALQGLPSSIDPGVTTSFTVSLDQSVAGYQSGSLTFATNDGSLRESVFEIRLIEAQPEINVVGAADSGQVDIGSAFVGTPIEKTFTIENTGNARLSLGAPEVSGPFQVIDFPTSIPRNGAASFTISVDSSTAGPKTGQISFDTNDANENPFDFTVIATVARTAPEIQVRNDAGALIRDDTGRETFTTDQFASGQSSFTVENVGSAPLTVRRPRFSNSQFRLLSPDAGAFPRTLAANERLEVTYQVSTTTTGSKTTRVSIDNDDDDENPFDFTVIATVDPPQAKPEIDVRTLAGEPIRDNTGEDYFATRQGSSGQRTLRISNLGTGDLKILSRPTLSRGFSLVTSGFPKTIEPQQSLLLIYQVDTTTAGTKTGTIRIPNDDADENPYNFSLRADVERASPRVVARHYFSLEAPRTLSGGVNVADSDVAQIEIFDDGSYEFSVPIDLGQYGLSPAIENVSAFTLFNGDYLISTTNGGAVGSIAFREWDVMRFDPDTGDWSVFFEGSSHGLIGSRIDAIAYGAGDRLYLSIDDKAILPNVAGGQSIAVDDSDVVVFHRRTGVWSELLNGLDANLVGSSADIDALSISNGLEISTRGPANPPGTTVLENTVARRVNEQWQTSFDGADYGISGVNLDAFHTVPILARDMPAADVLHGDFNGDNEVNDVDVDLLAAAIRATTAEARFDLNRSGSVDHQDFAHMVGTVLNTSIGDANLDGEFNTNDLILVFQANEYEDGVANNSGWSSGDWNGDGEFDTQDLIVAFQEARFEQGPRRPAV